MSEIGKKIDYVVKTGLAPVLKAAGFKSKGRTRKETGDSWVKAVIGEPKRGTGARTQAMRSWS
jgi:hypothetical protein